MEELPLRCSRCGSLLAETGAGEYCVLCLLRRSDESQVDEDWDARFLNWKGLDIPEVILGTVGNYELTELIGRGGMGLVYRARQKGLDRNVALKLVARGIETTPEARARLTQEARLAAKLSHPNIVPVYEVGEHEGLPYYSMELVVSDDGTSAPNLEDLVKKTPLPPIQAARYVMCVAQAVEYAHQREVLHRDLKPSNVLLGTGDQPRITDFGLATQLNAEVGASMTRAGLGTPGYYPPEQAAGTRDKIGPSSDVYGMGGILYCLLTRNPPFTGATIPDIMRQVMESEPRPPRALNCAIPRDLETICLKCLEKEPARRYRSAVALAEDLERFLRGEPIRARRAGPAERLEKWCRRKPVVAALSLVSIGLFLTGFATAVALWLRAEARGRETEHAYKLLALNRAEEYFANGEPGMSLAYLADVLRRDPHHVLAAQRAVSTISFSSTPEVHLLPLTNGVPVHALRFSPDSSVLGVGDESGRVHLLDTRSGRSVGSLDHPSRVLSVDFDREGMRALTVVADGGLRIWETPNGRLANGPWWHGAGTLAAELSNDGRHGLSLLEDGSARIWDTGNFLEICRLEQPNDRIIAAAFLREPGQFRGVSAMGVVQDWSLENGKLDDERFEIGEWEFLALARDGRWLAVGRDSELTVLDLDRRGFKEHSVNLGQDLRSLSISRDGAVVAASLGDGAVRLISCNGDLQFLTAPSISRSAIIELNANGSRVAAADFSGYVREWATWGRRQPSLSLNDGRPAVVATFSPQNDFILLVEDSGLAALYPVTNALRRVELKETRSTRAACFSPKGTMVLLADSQGLVHVHSRGEGWRRTASFPHPRAVRSLALSHDEDRMLTTWGSNAVLWSMHRPGSQPLILGHPRNVLGAEFSPDGGSVLTVAQGGVARVWEAKSQRVLLTLDGGAVRRAAAMSLARFSPNGRSILIVSGAQASLWDATTGEPLGTDLGGAGTGGVLAHAFSPDGRLLALALADGSVRIMTVDGSASDSVVFRTGSVSEILQFSEDGMLLISASETGGTRLWEIRSGLPATVPFQQPGKPVGASMTSDARFAVVAGASGAWLYSMTRMTVPVPDGLPDLLESIGGRSLLSGQPEDAGSLGGMKYGSELSLREPQQADWGRWVKWFHGAGTEATAGDPGLF